MGVALIVLDVLACCWLVGLLALVFCFGPGLATDDPHGRWAYYCGIHFLALPVISLYILRWCGLMDSMLFRDRSIARLSVASRPKTRSLQHILLHALFGLCGIWLCGLGLSISSDLTNAHAEICRWVTYVVIGPMLVFSCWLSWLDVRAL